MWEYIDSRVGWKYTILLVEQMHHINTTLAKNWTAHVLFWDTDYEFNGPYKMVLPEWEIRQWYKKIE